MSEFLRKEQAEDEVNQQNYGKTERDRRKQIHGATSTCGTP
jgi:hypothetical protein